MAYLGNTPTNVVKFDFKYIATDGQTVFSGLDTQGGVLAYSVSDYDVIVNGLLLPTDQYTGDGASLTLNIASNVGDYVTLRSYGWWTSVDNLSKSLNLADVPNKDQAVSNLGLRVVGNTGARPTGKPAGFQYFDTTLNKPIWYNGTVWVDATGTTV
jgi:hypothetical protein